MPWPNTRNQIAILALLALFVPVAFAQNDPPPPPAPPPVPVDDGGPGRGVARLSLINGEVSVRRGDSGEVIAGAMNAPIMVGDAVISGMQSRAEIQFDYSNMIRLGAGAEVRLSELEFHRYMLQLASGTVTFRVFRNNDASIELSTPSVAMRPTHRGVYRVSIRPDGASEITVRIGDLDVYTPRGNEHLVAGQAMLVRGGPDDPEYQIFNGAPEDEWDRWNAGRDQTMEHASAYQHVNPDIYGAEDLDGNGQWVSNAQYGDVWAPTVSTDWAPYRNGRWVWEDYYGWTWVSYDSWGWAPYHFGRWYMDPVHGWCWWPGARVGHAYWRPALVGFFGFGGGAGVGVGFGYGSVGWVPLAPFEPFHPWWGRGIYGGYRGGPYINNTFVTGGVNVAGVYRNARHENAVTGMSSAQFGHAGVNSGSMIRVSRADMQGAGLVRGQLPVSPSRASLHASDRAARTGLSSSSGSGRFFTTRQPTAVSRVPFEQQRARTEQTFRSVGSSGYGGSGGWRPATAGSQAPPAAYNRAGPPASTSPAATGGWRRVEPGGSASGAYHPQSGTGPSVGASGASYERQPLRMNPSIVRPRPSSGQPSYRPASGPSGSRPSAPPPSSSGRSGGGGGGSRPSGGGGGGHSGGHGR